MLPTPVRPWTLPGSIHSFSGQHLPPSQQRISSYCPICLEISEGRIWWTSQFLLSFISPVRNFSDISTRRSRGTESRVAADGIGWRYQRISTSAWCSHSLEEAEARQRNLQGGMECLFPSFLPSFLPKERRCGGKVLIWFWLLIKLISPNQACFAHDGIAEWSLTALQIDPQGFCYIFSGSNWKMGWIEKMDWKVLQSRKILTKVCRNLCSGAWSTSLPPSSPLGVCRAVSLTLLLTKTGHFFPFKIFYPRGVPSILDRIDLGQLQIHPGASTHCPYWTLGNLLAASHLNHPWSHSLPKICHANPISLLSQKVSATGTPWATLCANQNVSKASEGFFLIITICSC